jgi:cell division inhibitor SepF
MSKWNAATSWLGLNSNEAAAYPAAAPAAAPRAQNVTRLIPSRSSSRGASSVTEIQTFQPRSYAEAKEIAEYFRMGIPVIINFADLPQGDRNPMLHFLFGLKEGLEGTIKRVTSEVFLLGPASVWVSDEDEDDAPAAGSHDDDLVIRP